jgi:hypothetical protein
MTYPLMIPVGKEILEPDAFFAAGRWFYPREIDRSTETISGMSRSSIANKMRKYVAGIRTGAIAEHFGIPNRIRPTLITNNKVHKKNLQRYFRDHMDAPDLAGLFLFGSVEGFRADWTTQPLLYIPLEDALGNPVLLA